MMAWSMELGAWDENTHYGYDDGLDVWIWGLYIGIGE